MNTWRDEKGHTGESRDSPRSEEASVADIEWRSERWGIAACLAAGLFVLLVTWVRLGSVDLGYHVAYGRHFLDNGRIVDRDPFLYEGVARAFVNANWGSQVIVAAAERIGGAWGLIGLRTGLIVVIFGFVALAVRRAGGGLLAVAWAWLAAGAAGYERLDLRPELFSYACLAALLWILCRGPRTRRWVIAAAAIQLAWVNLHSYFLVGLIMTGCWTAGALVDSVRSRGDAAAEARRRWRGCAAALGLQIAVCLVNPAHVHGALFPFATLQRLQGGGAMGAVSGSGESSPWAAISEFHSPFQHVGLHTNERTIHVYWVILGIAAFGGAALVLGIRIGALCALVALVAMSVQMRRNIALLAIGLGPVLAPAWAAVATVMTRRAWGARYARRGLAAAVIGLSLWGSVSIVTGRFYTVEERTNRVFGAGYNERVVPTRAMQWLADQPELMPNLFADYYASSNTLPRLPERFRLFVDTNTFAYDESTLAAAHDLGLGRIDHRAFFREHDVNVLLLSAQANTESLIRAVAQEIEWRFVYF